jgi:hypothetical protein
MFYLSCYPSRTISFKDYSDSQRCLWSVSAGGNNRSPDEIVGASYDYSVLATSPDASSHLPNLLFGERFLLLSPRVPTSPFGFSLPFSAEPFCPQPSGLFL